MRWRIEGGKENSVEAHTVESPERGGVQIELALFSVVDVCGRGANSF